MPAYLKRRGVFGLLRSSWFVSLASILELTYPMPTSGAVQEPDTLDIPAAVACDGCRIHLDSVVVLGDETGEGFVDATNEVAAGRELFFVVHRVVSDGIKVFKRDGSFLATIGRQGDGPGEYRDIRALWVAPGDTLHVIDAGSLRRTLLSPGLEVVGTQRLPGRVRHYGYVGLRDGTAVLAAIAPDSVGQLRLLHRLSRDGTPLYSLGAPMGGQNESNTPPTALVRIPVETKDGSILVSHGNDFFLEAYGDEGTLESVLRFSDREFLELVPGEGLFPAYQPWIQDLWVDEADRLWVMMRVGDPDWEDGVERVGVGFGRRPSVEMVDYDSFWDTVIEVIDLEKGEAIARRRFEKNLIKFLGSNEATGRTLEEGGAIRLPIFRLRLEYPPRG